MGQEWYNDTVAEDDGRGWGFPGQKTNFHPPKAFNRHLILHPAVQSKCQVFGEEIWSNFASLRTQNQGAGGCDFSCPDVPTSNTDKAVMRGRMSYVFGGICCDNKDIWCKNYVERAMWNDLIPAKSCLKVCAKTLNWCWWEAFHYQTLTHTLRCYQSAGEENTIECTACSKAVFLLN